MRTEDFRQVKDLLDGDPEIGGVYFRPTDSKVTIVDLHAKSPKPRVGVGADPYLRIGTTPEEIHASIPDRINHLQAVRARQSAPSRENQFEARIIREAQSNNLRMPGFPDRLRFINSQWRVDKPGGQGQQFLDLVAVDLVTKTLVLIELKREADSSAISQVEGYLAYFRENAEALNPFFLELSQVMGSLYDCPELMRLHQLGTATAGLAAWPASDGRIVVLGLEKLSSSKEVIGNALGNDQNTEASSSVEGGMDIGPQYAGDSPFTARMRLHQSWYRAASLGVPCGTGPQKGCKNHYGNMLRPVDGEKGLNFLTPEIFEITKQRLADNRGAVEPFRLLHNMLSSQPMCFNLFGPLVIDDDLATRLFKKILPGEVEQVTKVAIEYAPEPRGQYLGDNTAFDAFVEFIRKDGTRGFVGIETKLTEPFSQKVYDSPQYRRWSERDDSPWSLESWDRLADKRHNQLWRDHLLAVSMLRINGSPYASGYCMLVRHPEDVACAKVVNGYSELLKPDDESFVDCPLDHLAASLGEIITGSDEQKWLDEFSKRYLRLPLSEELWREHRGC